jgi:hypothetical protein
MNKNLSIISLVSAITLLPSVALAAEDYNGWSLNFTPVLIMPKNGDDLGGGVDPEIDYTLDEGVTRISAGLRFGGYYAKNVFGITAMPTMRLTVPVGPVEPYVSFGLGYGWIPEQEDEGVASMSRLGVVFRITESLALGLEGTLQQIEGTGFQFPSIGSMLSFEL